MPFYQILNLDINNLDNYREPGVADFPNNVWKTEDLTWAERVGAIEITKEEAQTLVDAFINEALANWDPTSGDPEPIPLAFS